MEAAMETVHDKYEFRVRWLPFLLRPDMPPEGVEKPAAYSDLRNPRAQHLINAGASVGLEFTGKSTRFPNTLPAHAVLEYVLENHGHDQQNKLMELIFQGYFTDGVEPTPENMADMAGKVGLDKDEIISVARDSSKLVEAKQKALDASRRGCSGVPLFYMNGQRIFSGAQDSHAFVNMFEIVADRFPVTPTASI